MTRTYAVRGFGTDGTKPAWAYGQHSMPVSLNDLGQRVASGKTTQPLLAIAHARLSVDAPGILNHAMREHRPKWESAIPNSILRAIKVRYLIPGTSPAPLTGRAETQATEVRAGGERGHSTPAPMADSVNQYPDAGGVKVAARTLLAEPRSAGSEETWNVLMAKFPPEDHAAVSAAAATAVVASATEGED